MNRMPQKETIKAESTFPSDIWLHNPEVLFSSIILWSYEMLSSYLAAQQIINWSYSENSIHKQYPSY